MDVVSDGGKRAHNLRPPYRQYVGSPPCMRSTLPIQPGYSNPGQFTGAAAQRTTLTGGALASNVVWVVMTSGASAHVEGVLLGATSATFRPGLASTGAHPGADRGGAATRDHRRLSARRRERPSSFEYFTVDTSGLDCVVCDTTVFDKCITHPLAVHG